MVPEFGFIIKMGSNKSFIISTNLDKYKFMYQIELRSQVQVSNWFKINFWYQINLKAKIKYLIEKKKTLNTNINLKSKYQIVYLQITS